MRKTQFMEALLTLHSLLHNFIASRQCYLCHQTSKTLVCKDCLDGTVLPLFPVPGHNLLDDKHVYSNLLNPAYEGLYSLGRYEGIIQKLTNQLKFSKKALVAPVLAQFFERYVCPALTIKQKLPDAIIPIPLSTQRHMLREYNQARLIAQSLSQALEIDLIDALVKTRHTPQQSSLHKEERLGNINKVFKINKHINANKIAIIDDVVTTGATVNEACTTILKAYPNMQIDVWCMGITLHK